MELTRSRLSQPPFAGRTGAGIVIGVVDSGVHAGHPHVGEVRDGAWLGDGEGDSQDRLGHGTAVAAAIRDIAPGAGILVTKVFDRSLATSGDILARAISWAAVRGARIINLSLGTTNPRHEPLLRDAIQEAAQRGAVVVAARESQGVSWLPGTLDGVVPVLADPTLERDELRVRDGAVHAAPWPRPIPGVQRERNLSGVSFAVANTSGFIARLLESDAAPRTADDVLAALRG